MRPRFSTKEATTTTVVDASDDLEAGLDDFPIDDDMDILQFLDDDDAPGGGASGGASSTATDASAPSDARDVSPEALGVSWDARVAAETVAKLRGGLAEPAPLADVFHALLALRAESPVALEGLPRRPSASPLAPARSLSYVVCRRLCRAGDVEDRATAPSDISVTFQSILNSEIWWSPVAGLGVVARPMGRSARAWVAGPDGVASRTGRSVPHGGRRRPPAGFERRRAAIVSP